MSAHWDYASEWPKHVSVSVKDGYVSVNTGHYDQFMLLTPGMARTMGHVLIGFADVAEKCPKEGNVS